VSTDNDPEPAATTASPDTSASSEPQPIPDTATSAEAAPTPDDATTPPAKKKTMRLRVLAVGAGVIAASLSYAGVSALLNSADGPGATPSTIDAPTAVTYTSDEYRFSVQFPSEPSETTQTQAILSYEIELLTVQWVNHDTLYSANAATFPEEIIAGQELDSLLQNSMGGVASATGGTLSDQNFIDVEGRRAIAAIVSYPTEEVGRVMIVLDGLTQYSLLSTGSESDWSAFLDSFTFTG